MVFAAEATIVPTVNSNNAASRTDFLPMRSEKEAHVGSDRYPESQISIAEKGRFWG
jgi:hypothetical protein